MQMEGMKDAVTYVRFNAMQSKDAEDSINEFAHLFTWNKNERVLDVGCGPGDVTCRVLKAFVPNDAQLVGGDVAEKMVAYASSQFKRTRLDFEKLNIENVAWDTWEKGSFDKIFSFYCLHWIRDQRLAMQNIFNLLKPDGQAFLVFLAKVPIFDLYKKLSKTPQWAPYMKDADKYISPYHDSKNPDSEVERLLIDQKFARTKVACKKKTFTYDSTQHLLSSIIAVNPFIERIPNDLIAEYKKDITELALKSVQMKDNGSLQVTYSLIIAYAVKLK